MLRQLYIKNFALIDELDTDLHDGFTAITGETGAGKSIILGALGLLLGRRAESRQVKAGEKRCIIEAHFTAETLSPTLFDDNDLDYDATDTVLRREVTAAGKSRAFVNDTPVSLPVLRTIASQLIDIHSQHQNLLLERTDFQLRVLDIMATDDTLLADYTQAFTAWHDTEQQLSELRQSLQRSQAEEDFMRYQLAELQKANLSEGEQEELEQEALTLEHAEDIKTALYEADTLLSGEQQAATDAVRRARLTLEHIAKVYPQVATAAERLDSLEIELRDIASDISANLGTRGREFGGRDAHLEAHLGQSEGYETCEHLLLNGLSGFLSCLGEGGSLSLCVGEKGFDALFELADGLVGMVYLVELLLQAVLQGE